jgi:hypothetical protein
MSDVSVYGTELYPSLLDSIGIRDHAMLLPSVAPSHRDGPAASADV